MGLTHHWRRPTELPTEAFRAAVEDCRKLLGNTPIAVAGFDGTGSPILNKDQIVFNGRAPQACEPFELAAVEFDRHGRTEVFSYCKTQHLPYDLLVKAVLIVFSNHLTRSFRVTSDADESDWDQARDLVNDRLGYGTHFTLAQEPG